MMETSLLIDAAVVTDLSKKHNEPEWLLKTRLEALENASRLPLPKTEKSNIDRWNFTRFTVAEEEAGISDLNELPEDVREYVFDAGEANVLVQKNGTVLFHQATEELKQQGVIFTDLHTAAREHEELFRKYFMTEGVKKDEHRLAALHAALFAGGMFLYVPKNVELSVPVQALFWLSGAEAGMLPHILVVAENHSRVDVVANFVSLPGEEGAVNNSVIEVFVGAGAVVRVATVNNLGSSVVDATYRRSLVDRDGRLEWIVADMGEGRTLSDNTVHLNGKGGSADVKAVVLGTGDMRANVTTSIHHRGEHTASDINARSVMKDSASSILNSITKIEKGAKKSDGQQASKVLMLNAEARGDANPILLIDENDVVAGHAASVGRVDPLQLYYLMSRGISQAKAEQLIIRGFLDAVVSEIPSEALRNQIHRVMERKLQR
jgi:Fe-S cluster assembly protein SufD